MNSHPKEKEIQEYLLNKQACSIELIKHIESCAICREETAHYQLLFNELRQQPAASFDFDLSAEVLSRLPEYPPRMTTDNFIAGFLVIFSCLCIGIPVYYFRQNIRYMFSGMPVVITYAIVISTAIILIARILAIFKKYQYQMRILNFNQPF